MIRSLLVAGGLFAAISMMSYKYIGYSNAGSSYISKQRELRKSIRPGYYGYAGSRYASGGIRRGGK